VRLLLFVRCQIGLLAVLPFWWLGGAAVVMSTAA
jgi:hypothetical protein